jgi:hypothetical protein
VWGGVQLGPLGTSATNWPVVPVPDDYEDGEFGGMMIGWETEVLGENLSQCHFVRHKYHMTHKTKLWQDASSDLRSWSNATNSNATMSQKLRSTPHWLELLN